MRTPAHLSSSGQQDTVGSSRSSYSRTMQASFSKKNLYYGLKSIPLKNLTEVESSRKGGRSTAPFEVFGANRLTRT
jgi:hypothetical protein